MAAGHGDLDSQLVKYDQLDVDKFVDQQEAVGGGRGASGAAAFGSSLQPVSSSWLTWHVKLPSRVAILTMGCIFIYEVLVGVSMGVRVLRFVMVSWLAWVLLAINGALLLFLAGIVMYHKLDCSSLRRRRGGESAEAKAFEE
jgi:hypothetical protein